MQVYDDRYFMQQALQQARLAFDSGEVPVGAVVVANNQIIGRGHNCTEQLIDVTAHAEIIALTAASNYLQSKYLHDCTLYVTLEPCVMCAGALYWSQISRVVFGAQDDKRGFVQHGSGLLHPSTKLAFGVEMEACSALLKQFFAARRKNLK